MKVYKFKCKNCGSNKYQKLDKTTYKCSYCGNTEEVFIQEEKKPEPVAPVEPIIDEHEEEGTIVFTKRGAKRINTWKLVLVIACFFGGYFGLHRFMQGKIITGLLWMFTGGLFGIGYILDLFRLVIDFARHTHDA